MRYGGASQQGPPQPTGPPSGPVCDTEQAKAVAKRLFDAYDRDQNGQIDMHEVSPMMVDAYRGMGKGFNPTPSDMETFKQVLDVNGDGRVTYQDIEQFAIRILTGQQGPGSYGQGGAGQFGAGSYVGSQGGSNSGYGTGGGYSSTQQTTNVTQQRRFSKAVEERLEVARRLFKKFDSDQDGYIQEGDVGGLLRETYNNSFNPTSEDIKAWMDLTDEDRDGRVSIEEFESAVIKGLQEAGIKLY